MLERNLPKHDLKPKVYPFPGKKSSFFKPIRRVKLPKQFADFDFELHYHGNLYPSTKWESENQGEYTRWTKPSEPRPEFLITSLDSRKHNPQSRKIFHIRRIDKKPVCTVADLVNYPEQKDEPRETIYMSSFAERESEPREIIHKADAEKVRLEHSIVPLNGCGDGYDVKPEMMLPVCDPSFMPSAKDPNKYLARKRRVPPPYKSSGVVYPNLEHPRMTSYVPGKPRDGADLPFSEHEDLSNIPDSTERVSVSSLSGLPFSRRKFIAKKHSYILPGSSNPPVQSKFVSITSLLGQKFTRRRVMSSPLSDFSVCSTEPPVHTPFVSVTSLAGRKFTRRRVIPSPPCEFAFHTCADGGESYEQNNSLLPYMKAKSII